MLFNSYIFVFAFLPAVLAVFFLLGGRGHGRAAIGWLVAASLIYYGWWNPLFIGLIVGSMLFNYVAGITLGRAADDTGRKVLLIAGVAVNLGVLGYFKYANFFIDNLNALAGADVHIASITLPIGISFFTFQQIAYLADAYRGEAREYNLLNYALFVTFFPQLIAGPIVHHKEMLPQFARKGIGRPNQENLAVGLTIFVLGLFKKVVLADGVSVYATPVFVAAEHGIPVSFFEAWSGALAYTFQLYFDFSGYSDMAVGIARMFGIRLPLNFNSPYKATSIIDFWRRWHVTLSRFLRDYVYIPLGGNRRGRERRYVNLMITMVLGGLWHGAGWTFVLWGALHGLYLMINHGWRALRGSDRQGVTPPALWRREVAWVVTFVAVVVAWVPFRAESMQGATVMLAGMAGLQGFVLPEAYRDHLNHIGGLGDQLAGLGWEFRTMDYFAGANEVAFLLLLLLIVKFAPNPYQLMHQYRPALETLGRPIEPVQWPAFLWRPTQAWAALAGLLLAWTTLSMYRVREFLYYQF